MLPNVFTSARYSVCRTGRILLKGENEAQPPAFRKELFLFKNFLANFFVTLGSLRQLYCEKLIFIIHWMVAHPSGKLKVLVAKEIKVLSAGPCVFSR